MPARGSITFFHHCHHVPVTVPTALTYCLILSTIFVLTLYYIMPSSVRALPRDNERQIRWRIISVLMTSTICILSYPLFFCATNVTNDTDIPPIVWEYLGWRWLTMDHLRVVSHVVVLYAGSIVAILLNAHVVALTLSSDSSPVTPQSSPSSSSGILRSKRSPFSWTTYIRWFIRSLILPTWSTLQGSDAAPWAKFRDLIVAPLAEEIVFRSCMVPPLLVSGIHPTYISFIAPLFFGLAHFHHALTKIRSGMDLSFVLLTTVFQFTYTSLFGIYAVHAFLRTGSLLAVVLCHSFCNFMGLPDFSFWNKNNGSNLSTLYRYRTFLAIVYFMGILCFVFGFQHRPHAIWNFFPANSVLLSVLRRGSFRPKSN